MAPLVRLEERSYTARGEAELGFAETLMKRSLATTPLVLATLFLLAGCGGGGGSKSSSSTNATPVSFSLGWGERSRAVQGPSSALSATLTLIDGAEDGGDLSFTVNRSASVAAYTQTYVTPTRAKVGARALVVRFYANAGGTGAIVAQAAATVNLDGNGDGVGTIGVTNTVTQVGIPTGQTVEKGTPSQLTFEARDSANGLVAVTPGSGVWKQTGGGESFTLSADGVATPMAVGVGNVTVTVDGLTSEPATVSVVDAPVATVTVDPNQTLAVGTTKQLTFTARDAQGNVVMPRRSPVWTNVSDDPDLTLTPAGVATAVQTGDVAVRVTVDGVTSAFAIVTVVP